MAKKQQRRCQECGSVDYVSRVSADGCAIRCCHCGTAHGDAGTDHKGSEQAATTGRHAQPALAFIIVLSVCILLLVISQLRMFV